MSRLLVLFLFIIASADIAGQNASCSSSDWVSQTPSADMAYYRLYLDNKESDPEKAYGYAELFLSKLDSLPHNISAVQISDELADYYENDKFLFTKAIQWREASYKALVAMGMEHKAAQENLAISRIQLKKGMYHLALKHANDAESVFSSEKDTFGMMECYSILGTLFETCKDEDMAERYFDSYISLAYERQDTARMFVGLNNTAVSASTAGETLKTLHLLEESVRKAESSGDSTLICQLYLNLAAMYIKSEDYEKSEACFNNARPLIKTVEERSRYSLYYGNLCFIQAKYKCAAEYFTDAVRYFEEGEYYSVLSEVLPLLAESLMQTGHPEQAYARLRQLNDIYLRTGRDNVFLEFFREKYKMDLADFSEAEKKENRRDAILISVLGVILSGIVVFMLIRNIRMKQQIVQMDNDLKSAEESVEYLKIKQMQYDRMIESIIERMGNAEKHLPAAEIREMITGLNAVREEDSLKQIRQFIPGSDKEFYNRLITDFPNLSVNESRLCVLLNQNLSSKEICTITMQTPQSLNVARTRLRKKLGLTGKDISIQEFLRKYN